MITLSDLNPEPLNLILEASNLPEHEKNNVTNKLFHAFRKWVNNDINECASWTTEEEFEGMGHGFLDLVKFKHDGSVVIVDWKTTSNYDRPNFTEEKTEDPQTPLYLGFGGRYLSDKYACSLPTQLEYRFVDDSGNCKTVTVFNKPHYEQEARNILISVDRMFFSQTDLTPWAMNKPSACFFGSKAGATCPYWKDCCGDPESIPKHPTSYELMLEKRPKSKSAIKDFLRCPERYRRSRLMETESLHEGIESKMGTVFHDLMDCCYKQIKEMLG